MEFTDALNKLIQRRERIAIEASEIACPACNVVVRGITNVGGTNPNGPLLLSCGECAHLNYFVEGTLRSLTSKELKVLQRGINWDLIASMQYKIRLLGPYRPRASKESINDAG